MAVVVTNLTSLQSWIRMYASSAIQLQWARFQARYGKNNLQATEHTIARREYHSISLTRSKALSKGLKISAVLLPKLIIEIYSGFLKFESVGEIMWCDYTKENLFNSAFICRLFTVSYVFVRFSGSSAYRYGWASGLWRLTLIQGGRRHAKRSISTKNRGLRKVYFTWHYLFSM